MNIGYNSCIVYEYENYCLGINLKTISTEQCVVATKNYYIIFVDASTLTVIFGVIRNGGVVH